MTKKTEQSGTSKAVNQVILVDDNESLLINVSDYLSLFYDKVETFTDPEQALARVTSDFPGVIVTDVKMPKMTGMDLLQRAAKEDRDLPVILMTAHGDISQAVEAIKIGAYDFIEKPFEPERLKETVDRAMEKRQLTLTRRQLEETLQYSNSIESRLVGCSAAIDRVRRQVLNLASMDVPVLIFGETGTGKEVVANCLHDYGNRNQFNFVPLNCAAIPGELIESELFGHAKGAFSGAVSNRVGKLEYANKGTVFLDEVESIPLSVQVKLLRALSEGNIEAVGSNKPIPIDIRVVSATKESLKDNENFRQDLYFRLQVAEIYIPPLRQRKEDITLLFDHYARSFANASGIDWDGINNGLQSQLLAYDWPGNVRELINVATRCVMQEKRDLNELSFFGDSFNYSHEEESLKQLIEQYEKGLITDALRQYRGDISQVMAALKIERRTFYLKLKKYDINRQDFVDVP